jgi:hypothetical protein
MLPFLLFSPLSHHFVFDPPPQFPLQLPWHVPSSGGNFRAHPAPAQELGGKDGLESISLGGVDVTVLLVYNQVLTNYDHTVGAGDMPIATLQI